LPACASLTCLAAGTFCSVVVTDGSATTLSALLRTL
jgi:hypothetical protein